MAGIDRKSAMRAHFTELIQPHLAPLIQKQLEMAYAGDGRALDSLLNRAMDKPTEHHEITAHAVPLFALPASDDVSTANPHLLENRPENDSASQAGDTDAL